MNSRDENGQALPRQRQILLAYAVVLTVGTLVAIAIPTITGSFSFYFYLLMWISLASGLNIMAGFVPFRTSRLSLSEI